MGKSGRPSWWEVPPYGYLEIESRNAPTRPRALRTLAKSAARAGLSWSPEHPLPAQGFVEAHERARLVFHARRELPRVTAVASQVMVTESRLAEAEALLRQAVSERSAAAARHRAAERAGPAAYGGDTGDAAAGQPSAAAAGSQPSGHVAGDQPSAGLAGGWPSAGAARREQPGRRHVLGQWSEALVLAVVAGGEGALGYVVGRDLGLAALALALLTAAAAVGSIAAAQLAARGVDRLAVMPDGSDDPARRRRLDLTVAGAALACGVTLAVAMGYLSAGAGPAAVGLALLGLATAVSYAAIPDRSGSGARSRSLAARLRRLQEGRRSRRQLRLAQAREAAAQTAVNQLREELALLVPQLFAAEQAALLFWRYQVAIGDAAQHAFQQHLAAFSRRRSRGVWRPIVEWWSGAAPVPSDDGDGVSFASVAEGQSEWGDQVARVTMAAKRVLVRRGLLDITHGLRLSRLPGAPPAGRDGRPAPAGAEAVAGDGERPLVSPPPLDPDRPGER